MPEIDIAPSSGTGDSGLAPGLVTADTSNTLPDITTITNEPQRKLTEDEIWASPNKDVSKNEPTKEVVQEAPVAEKEVIADEVKPTDEIVEEEEPLVVEEDLSVAKINQFVKEIPELQAAFTKNPAVRNAVFAMARRSSKLGEYQAIIPTPEAAKFAAENSESFVKMNDLFFSDEPQSHVDFWDTLWNNSLLRDPATNEIVIDKQGNPIATGAYEKVTGTYRQAIYTELGQRAQGLPEEDKVKLLDAISLVKEYAGDGKRQTSQTNEPQLSQEQQRKLADADKVLQQSTQQRQEYVKEFNSQTSSAIVTTIKDDISGHVKRLVDTQGLALTPYEQKKVVDDIFNEVDRLASENRQYQSHFDSLTKRAPQTEAGRKSLVTEARKYAKEILPSAALKIIREATSATIEKSQTTQTKRVEQASRKEVKASGSAPTPAGSLSVKEKAEHLRQKLGRKLTEKEVMALV